jgi:hypothetical protein
MSVKLARLDLRSSYNAAHSEPRPKKPVPARWVTIWSKHNLVERVTVRDPIRTTAALYDTPCGKLLVYGTVMPRATDPGPSGTAPKWVEQRQVVLEQTDEWKDLRDRFPTVAMCVASYVFSFSLTKESKGLHHRSSFHPISSKRNRRRASERQAFPCCRPTCDSAAIPGIALPVLSACHTVNGGRAHIGHMKR